MVGTDLIRSDCSEFVKNHKQYCLIQYKNGEPTVHHLTCIKDILGKPNWKVTLFGYAQKELDKIRLKMLLDIDG